MTFYTSEVKQEFRNDIELGMKNLKSCISFVASLESNEMNYKLRECSKEFLILMNLKEDLDFSIEYGEEIEVAEVDYFLVRRWHAFSLETYKKHLLNS